MALDMQVGDDGTSFYTTTEGDMVDHVAFLFYGTHDGTTELLYAGNRHLVDLPMKLPAGVRITFPPLPAPAAVNGTNRNTINLWD